MSDEEDYLSDKFLVEVTTSQPTTYAQRRKEALKQSQIKNEQNHIKSRRQREHESREEGLSKTLFERAAEDKDGGDNKALGIMMKMGFKIGQSLGQSNDSTPIQTPPPLGSSEDDTREPSESTELPKATHKTEPLPLNEWLGKKGIGLGKRQRSPGASERMVKMAKMAEEASKESFRDRSRREYEERRAEARLAPAQRTCMTLDEKAGITFNVLWLNPHDVDSVPKGLMDALSEFTPLVSPMSMSGRGNEASRLRDQMSADALQPVAGDDNENGLDDNEPSTTTEQGDFSPETVEEAACFIRLGPQDRLSLVLGYLREEYAYCFWCGTQYEDADDLGKHCPGPSEDHHD